MVKGRRVKEVKQRKWKGIKEKREGKGNKQGKWKEEGERSREEENKSIRTTMRPKLDILSHFGTIWDNSVFPVISDRLLP